ncbi:MAG: 1-(5-phosphoribosyl)-5-[(5-phosphoribosylamino)methylideneamino]imidazole-4-carboxamide isomerase [Bacteroidia bacterium]
MIEIIPAIDIIDGKCVRLSQGDFAQKKIYNENPLEVAKQFEEAGIKRLHVVDLDGAKQGKVINLKVLEQISSQTKLIIDFGGGIKTTESARQVFDAGAKMISIGTVAVKNPKLFQEWILKFGSENILLGADVKKEQIVVSGWTENTSISIFNFISENILLGIKNIFCTDVSLDGMLQGPALSLYNKVLKQFPSINLIASGGVNSIEDIFQLEKAGCSGVIIGKAIYEGKIKLLNLKPFLS